MAASDPVLERIAAHSFLAMRRGAGAPVARLKPLPSDDRVEVLWWRRDAWRPAGAFGAVLTLSDALAFIAAEPAFWIRA